METLDYNYQNSFCSVFLILICPVEVKNKIKKSLSLHQENKNLNDSGSCGKMRSSCNCFISAKVQIFT